MTTNEKIAALRAAAQAAGAHGVLLMTSDPHSSEYLPAYYNSLPFFSGFTGENSTLVVTLTGSALWCDGRFYVQGDRQLAGTEIECMHAGSAGVPTVEEYLTAHFAAGQTLLLDGSCVPATIANGYAAALAKSGAKLESKDIVSPLWESLTTRPSLPNTPCELLTVEQTGATAAQRIAMVRDELKKAGATALAVTGLDCVGWLTNMRARDLPCTPLAVAYALVTMDSCTLFIAPGRLNDADAKTLADNGVSLRDYPELIDTVHALPAEEVFLVDEKATNYDLYCALNEHKTVTGADPIFALKGVKNPVELANIRECHVRDGVAMVRFQMDLEKAIAEGKIGTVVSGYSQFTLWLPYEPGNWRQCKAKAGGGAMMDLSVHTIDLMEYITGMRVTEVASMNEKIAFPEPQYDVEDTSTILMRMENGAQCVVQSNFNIPDEASKWRVEFFGTKGRLLGDTMIGQIDGGRLNAVFIDKNVAYSAEQTHADDVGVEIPGDFGNMYTREIESFSDSILNNKPLVVPASDAVHVQRIMEKAYASGEELKILKI